MGWAGRLDPLAKAVEPVTKVRPCRLAVPTTAVATCARTRAQQKARGAAAGSDWMKGWDDERLELLSKAVRAIRIIRGGS
jgi:hypothetical protein